MSNNFFEAEISETKGPYHDAVSVLTMLITITWLAVIVPFVIWVWHACI